MNNLGAQQIQIRVSSKSIVGIFTYLRAIEVRTKANMG